MNVLILGLGQYPKGSGISAALFFARQKANVRVTDQKTEQDLSGNVKKLRKFKNVEFVLGEHRLDDIRWADLIVRNPRVRPSSPEMKLAVQLGKRIESDISLFMALCPCPVVAITGTRGKSTTTTLVAEMLKASKYRVWLGGNILISPLTFVSKVKKTDLVVLELSSWLLETTGALGLSPKYALVTNIMRDHLNTYEGMEDYAEAKAQIFRHQKPDDVVVLNADDEYGARWMKEAPSKVLSVSAKSKKADARLTKETLEWTDPKTGKQEAILKRQDLRLLGDHNAMNVLQASLLSRSVGATVSAIKKVAREFKGVPDRLEQIADIKGIKIINDTTSTTPDATIAAIRALAPISNKIHLIAGGADKELEFGQLAKELKKNKVSVTLFDGTAYPVFSKALDKAGVGYQKMTSLKDAVAFHFKNARKGDCVLLSPGCASFGMFKNEFDRGGQFKSIVKKLKY